MSWYLGFVVAVSSVCVMYVESGLPSGWFRVVWRDSFAGITVTKDLETAHIHSDETVNGKYPQRLTGKEPPET